MVCAALSSAYAAPSLRLSRTGFTSASGLAPRGFHRSSGWSLGIPIAGLARAPESNEALYAGLWYLQFFAVPPPAPSLAIPVAALPGVTSSYTTLDYTLQVVGGKAPTVPYPYHAYAIAYTNGVRCEQSYISQLPDNSQWSLMLDLYEGEELELALICSNVFGESAAVTVLHVSQIPEPLCLAGIACIALALLTRGRSDAV